LFLAFLGQERNQQQICGQQMLPMADQFFLHKRQILRVIHFDDKATNNQEKSIDKLNAIRDVFQSIISRFLMTFIPSEHITSEEQVSGSYT
jgi:hypothetical protein